MGMIGNSLAQGLISGANIQDGTVDTPDIKDSAVTAAKIASGVVTPAKMDFSAGTANGVLYLNGSNVASSGSALVFDGTNFGVGTSSPSTYGKFAVLNNTTRYFAVSSSGVPKFRYDDNGVQDAVYQNSGITGGGHGVGIQAQLGDNVTNTSTAGYIRWLTEGTWSSTSGSRDSRVVFATTLDGNTSERMSLDSSGNLGVGTSSPSARVHANGGAIRCDLGSAGTSLVVTGTGSNFQVDHSVSSYATLLNSGGGLAFSANGSERMRIDTTGNLLVGTTTLTAVTSGISNLNLGSTSATTTGAIAYQISGATAKAYDYVESNVRKVQTASGVDIAFLPAGTEAMRISSAGAVTIGGYAVLTNNQGTEDSANSYTTMSAETWYRIGKLPETAGLYAVFIHMDSGTNGGGGNIYWEATWSAVASGITNNLYSGAPDQTLSVNSVYHHRTVNEPTFKVDSGGEYSGGTYGYIGIWVKFPQLTQCSGLRFYYKKLI